MNKFYVTFGMGTILRGYYLEVDAMNADIVSAWLKREGIRYSRVCHGDAPPAGKSLQPEAVSLFYADASHRQNAAAGETKD